MGRNRTEYARYRVLSEKYGIDENEVKRIVSSYFDTFLYDARKLPFDNLRKIYSKDKFEEYAKVRNVPYLGRLGPLYSRYLKWRANESAGVDMVPGSSFRRRLKQSDIENTAAAILSGQAPPLLEKKKKSELFYRVWLVGQDGKKSARQVIPKKES